MEGPPKIGCQSPDCSYNLNQAQMSEFVTKETGQNKGSPRNHVNVAETIASFNRCKSKILLKHIRSKRSNRVNGGYRHSSESYNEPCCKVQTTDVLPVFPQQLIKRLSMDLVIILNFLVFLFNLKLPLEFEEEKAG